MPDDMLRLIAKAKNSINLKYLPGGVTMPGGDRTGPPRGGGAGGGRGIGRGGRGGGRLGGNRPGSGPSGECVCPNCGARLPHQVATPCYDMSCPKCGAKMVKG